MTRHSIPHAQQPPSQKPAHRAAKHRRRRIDCGCGCSIYFRLECASHGFSHRGTTCAPAGNYWRLLLVSQEPAILSNNGRSNTTVVPIQPRLQVADTVQQHSQESIGSSPMLSQFPGLDDLQDIWASAVATPISILDFEVFE